MIISRHCNTQAIARYLESELAEGLVKIDSVRLPSEVRGEVNFIVERKTQILHRKGSAGDLVIIGIDWDRKIVKSIFLQKTSQVDNRMRKGRQYVGLLHK